jgi:quercetin dioxygenase-like cupin family protein
MITADLKKLELTQFTAVSNPMQACKSTFPLLGAHGTKDSAVVYFELEPGHELGSHTDSAEEILLVLEGEVEATIGERSGLLEGGCMAVVPKLMPHNVRNVGEVPAKVVGFFGGANHIVATFEAIWSPLLTNSVDTSKMGG